MIHCSITETICHTPIVRLNRIASMHVELYARIESFNPGGSDEEWLAAL